MTLRDPPPDERRTVAYLPVLCPYCGCRDSRIVYSAIKVSIRIRVHVCAGCRWAYRSIETGDVLYTPHKTPPSDG